METSDLERSNETISVILVLYLKSEIKIREFRRMMQISNLWHIHGLINFATKNCYL